MSQEYKGVELIALSGCPCCGNTSRLAMFHETANIGSYRVVCMGCGFSGPEQGIGDMSLDQALQFALERWDSLHSVGVVLVKYP